MHEWHSIAYHGDEWLVAYACIPSVATSASLFSIGHAVELYLKAVYAAKFGDVAKAIRYSHRVKDLWNACRAKDPDFMTVYQFRQELFDRDLLDWNVVMTMTTEEQMHYVRYQQFYLVFKHLQDLKYFGLPWKTRNSGPSSIAFIHPDPQWIEFFRGLRLYIGYPPLDHADHIAQILDLGKVPEAAATYLRGLYT